MPPFSHTWLPYIYLYGFGAIFFIIGIIITKRSGAMAVGAAMAHLEAPFDHMAMIG